ncbi:MAG: hypothetical protein VW274_09360, partial [Thalassolituus sp.]
MTEVYLDTGQQEKAQNMVQTLRDKGLEDDLLNRLSLIENQLSNINMREMAAELNEKGDGLYEKGL